jgi:hypothetical protein
MSYATFISTVSGLTITGVTRKYDHRPVQINSTDMPIQLLDLGGLEQNDDLTTCVDDGITYSVDLVVLVNPAGQDNAEPNYEAQVTMVDNVMTQLKTLSSNFFWSIATGIETITDVPCYVVRASIEQRL